MKLFGQVENMYGRLDLLINTGQFEATIDFLSTDETSFAEIIERNLKSAFFCSQAAVRLMINRPNPAIVNLVWENHANVLFTATQTALIGLTKSLAAELAPKIRVNCVSFSADKKPNEEGANNKLLRAVSVIAPNDVAQTVIYLLSPEAAAITGQMISVGAKRSKI
jgi:3-oxoacyl-[acyl-carrier protein] reductase